MVSGKLLAVRYDRSTVVRGAKDGPTKGPPIWIGLEDAPMRLFTADSESAAFFS